MGFKNLPGMLVCDKFTVSIPHPDPCWVIENSDGTWALHTRDGKLLGFSTEALLRSFAIVAEVPHDTLVISYTWDELVNKYAELHADVLIDHSGEAGFYECVPLQKGI